MKLKRWQMQWKKDKGRQNGNVEDVVVTSKLHPDICMNRLQKLINLSEHKTPQPRSYTRYLPHIYRSCYCFLANDGIPTAKEDFIDNSKYCTMPCYHTKCPICFQKPIPPPTHTHTHTYIQTYIGSPWFTIVGFSDDSQERQFWNQKAKNIKEL